MKKYKLIFCLIFGLMSGSIIHSQTTMTFSANKDATIFSENQTGSNGAGSLFAGRTIQPANRRALIRFDISGIPSDATITSAEFSVRGSMQSGTVNVHRLNADWGEGSTSGQGSDGGQPSTGQNGDATWSSNMLGSSTWNSSGGDFVAQSRGSANVSSGSRATWSSNAIVGDVQAWVDGTTDNFGWILIGNESSNNTAVRMNSRSNGANGPMLEVTYMVADACNVDGGNLTGGPFEFCVGDGQADNIAPNGINLSGNSGDNSQWVVTNASGMILGLPNNFTDTNFDGAGAGICLVRHLSYEDGLTGLSIGANVNNLNGCFDLSNSVTVNRSEADGGTLTGGPFTFCVGDGQADNIAANGINRTGNSGDNSQWVVTDANGMILGLPNNFTDTNFDGAGAGTCLVWHLSHADGLTGLTVGANKDNVQGCFDYSNSITVNRNQPEGGTLTGGPFEFCVGNGVPDLISANAITLSGNSGGNSQWVVTNETGMILGLPLNFTQVNFDGAGAGTCFVYHLSYEDGLTGLTADANISNLQGCFDLSNAVTVNRNQPDGGSLTGGPFEFCVGNGVPDLISANAITLSGNSGGNSQWVVTNETGMILGLPLNFTQVNFDGAGAGTCFVYHLSYEDGLTGLAADANISDLQGCFDLSNAVTVNRVTSGGVCPEEMIFVSTLAGTQSVPAFNSPGSGTVTGVLTGNSLAVSGTFMGLAGDFAASHIHMAPAGRTGGVIFPLTETLDADLRGGSYAAADNTFELSDEQVQTLKDRYYYVNIHTMALGSGEIRGQLLPMSEKYLATSLKGANENPPAASTGTGNVVLEITGNTLIATGGFNDLVGDFAMQIAGGSHIDTADAANIGGITFGLTVDLDDDLKGGKYKAADNTFTITDDEKASLMNGGTYVNIHTSEVNSGELRGQVLNIDNAFPARGFGITSPADGAEIEVSSDPNANVEVTWDATTDPNNDLLVYTWQAALDRAFSVVVFQQKVGVATSLTLPQDVIDGLLAPVLPIGQSITIFHRAVASDGSVCTEGEASSLTVTRVAPPEEMTFVSTLAGTQSVPAFNSPGSGTVTGVLTGNSLAVSGTFMGLAGDFAASHIHMAPAGRTGGVIFPLTETLDADLSGGSYAAAHNTFELSDEQVQTLKDRYYYVNIHTMALGSGEIRGQLLPMSEKYLATSLKGANENPPAASTGTGNVVLEITGNTLIATGGFNDLVGDFAMQIAGGSHIHTADAANIGGITFGLTVDLDDDLKGGKYKAADNTFTITDDEKASLMNGGTYVNIHTSEVNSGELRGQVLNIDNAFPARGFGITSPADGAEIEVSSDPNANVEVTWDATTDPNNDLLVYTWQAALDRAFSVVVFQQKVGVATSLTLPQDVIDGLLAPVLPIGQSITIFHRAVASDGSVCTEGEASSLTVTRVAPPEEMTFVSTLAGTQSVPAFNSPGSGTVTGVLTGNSLAVSGTFMGLAGDFAASHIHMAPAGRTGGVIFPLTETLDADLSGGSYAAAHNTFELSDEQVQTLKDRYYYVNIHTMALGSGEIRGQLLPMSEKYLATSLKGANENPPAASTGTGNVVLEITGNTLIATGGFNDLVGDFAMQIAGGSHIHTADAANIGGITFGLTVDLDDDLKGGKYKAADNTFTITDDEKASLMNGGTYVNIHTSEVNSGELRGQVLNIDNAFPARGFGITSPADGAEIEVSSDPNANVEVTWDATTDPNNDLLVYTWQAALDRAFSVVVFQQKVGVATSLTLPQDVIDGLLAPVLPIGQSITIFHRAVASDGSVCTEGEASSLTVTRVAVCDPDGGILTGGPFEFCVDGNVDNASGINLSGVMGSNQAWIITDDQGNILALPDNPSDVNFDNVGVGICFIYNISYEDGLTGLEAGNNIDQLDGCFNLSNPITVVRTDEGTICEPVDCAAPTSIVVELLSSRSFSVTWDKVDDARAYFIRIRFAGQEKYLIRARVRNTRVLVFGPSNRSYEIQIQTECSDGSLSPYTDIIPVSTAKSILAPTDDFRDGDIEILEVFEDSFEGLSVRPNPVADILSITYIGKEESEVILYAMDGRAIDRKKFNQGVINHRINVEALQSGVYILQVISESGTVQNERIVKMRR